MDIHRFAELALAHGAARERWPEADRALFDRFAACPEGTGILADAARIDALLDGWQPGIDDAGRAERIVAAANAVAHERGEVAVVPAARTVQRSRTVAAWLSTGFAASALLGFALGFTQASANSDDEAYMDLLLGSNTVMEEFL